MKSKIQNFFFVTVLPTVHLSPLISFYCIFIMVIFFFNFPHFPVSGATEVFFNPFRPKFCSQKALLYYAITLSFSLTICKSKSITPVSSFKPPEELSFPQKVFRSSSINLTSTQKFFNDSPGKKSCRKASKVNVF